MKIHQIPRSQYVFVSFQNWKSKGRTSSNYCFNAILEWVFLRTDLKVTLFDKLGALLLRIGNGSIFKKKRRDGVATFSFLEEAFHLTKHSIPCSKVLQMPWRRRCQLPFWYKKQIKGKGDQTPRWGGTFGENTIFVSVDRETCLINWVTSSIVQKRAVDNISISIHMILWQRRWHELRRTDPSYNLKVDLMFLAMKTRTVWRASGKASIPKRPKKLCLLTSLEG